jgi:hypothetical protein
MELKHDPRNARKHDQRNMEAIAASLRDLRAGRSILAAADGTVLAGNGTLKEAQAQGIPVELVHTQGERLVVVVRDDLDPDSEKARALALADNRTSDLSDWDFAGLADELSTLTMEAQAMAGFTPDEISSMFGVDPGATGGNNPPAGNGDKTYTCPECGCKFEG